MGAIEAINEPSVDTGTCAASVRAFNKEISELENYVAATQA